MNEKITTSELAELLAKRTRMTTEEAGVFVRRVFSLVVEILQEEKYLKIKDLGTFKLISVSSRESVAVNTGERILIEGYDKISFTPENGLRDLINRPFAHFETISLNEGIDFEEEEAESEEEEEIPEEEVEEVPKPSKRPAKPVSKTASRKKLVKQEEEEEEEKTPEKAIEKKTKRAEPEREKPVVAKKPLPEKKEIPSVSKEVPSKPVSSKAVPVKETSPKAEGPAPVAKREFIRTKPRLIRPEEEQPAPVEEMKASEPELQKEEESSVAAPRRVEVRKRKSILIQEPIPIPVAEQKEEPEMAPEGLYDREKRYDPKELPDEEDLYDQEEEPDEEELYEDQEEEQYEDREEEPYEDREEDLPNGEEFAKESEASPRKRKSFAVPFFICLSLLVVIIGTIAISYIYYPQWLKDLLHDEGQSITIITVDAPTVPEKIEEEAPEIVAELVEEAPKPVAEPAKKADEKTSLVAGERANPRDFKVAGTLTTLTIEGGSSLARLSKQYYGSRDLWTFIVEYNKDIITDPDNIPVGKTIKIPKLEKK